MTVKEIRKALFHLDDETTVKEIRKKLFSLDDDMTLEELVEIIKENEQ